MDDIVKNVKSAIEFGRTDVLLSLIEEYEKTNEAKETSLRSFLNDVRATSDGTFLHYATKLNQVDICRMLMLSGCDASVRNAEGSSAVDLASASAVCAAFIQELLRVTAMSDVVGICRLLDAGLCVNCHDGMDTRNTPLHWAAAFADIAAVRILLDRGAEVNVVNYCRASPLHDAVHRGQQEIVEELLRQGADSHQRASNGKFSNLTPLDLAASHHPELLDVFKKHIQTDSCNNSCDSKESIIVADDNSGVQNLNRQTSLDNKTTLTGDGGFSMEQPRCENIKFLWPPPQEIQFGGKYRSAFDRVLKIHVVQSTCRSFGTDKIFSAWHSQSARLSHLGYDCCFVEARPPNSSMCPEGIVCQINPTLFGGTAEAFSLTLCETETLLLASDSKGFHYSVCLLVQLLTVFKQQGELPLLKIVDHPLWNCRAVLLNMMPHDKSSNLQKTVEVLSFLRLNYLFLLYRMQSPRLPSPSDIHSLDLFCRERSINLVPAVEVPDSSLYDGRNLLEDVYRLVREYVPCFSCSRYLYLGRSLTSHLLLASEEAGSFVPLPVPPETCLLLNASAVGRDRYRSFHHVPLNAILLSAPPTKLVPGREYVSRDGPIDASCSTGFVIQSAIRKSITCCSEVVARVLHQAAKFKHSCKETCFVLESLCCQQQQEDCLVSPTFEWPNWVTLCGVAWNPQIPSDGICKMLPTLLNWYVFGADVLGDVVMELGRVEARFLEKENDCSEAVSLLFTLLTDPDGVVLDGVFVDALQRATRNVKACVEQITKISCPFERARQTIADEASAVADLLLFSIRLCRCLINVGSNPNKDSGLAVINVGLSNLAPTTRTDLANRLLEWTRRFRSQGDAMTKMNEESDNNKDLLAHLLSQLIPSHSDRCNSDIIHL